VSDFAALRKLILPRGEPGSISLVDDSSGYPFLSEYPD